MAIMKLNSDMKILGHNIVIDPKLLDQLRMVEGATDESIFEWYQSAQEYGQPLTVDEFQEWSQMNMK